MYQCWIPEKLCAITSFPPSSPYMALRELTALPLCRNTKSFSHVHQTGVGTKRSECMMIQFLLRFSHKLNDFRIVTQLNSTILIPYLVSRMKKSYWFGAAITGLPFWMNYYFHIVPTKQFYFLLIHLFYNII